MESGELKLIVCHPEKPGPELDPDQRKLVEQGYLRLVDADAEAQVKTVTKAAA